EGQIVDNARRLLGDITRDADDRAAPAITTAQEWHRRIYEGVALPVAYYAGGIRDSDSDQPELYGYEVAVGPFTGVASQDVPDELEAFERNAQQSVAGLD